MKKMSTARSASEFSSFEGYRKRQDTLANQFHLMFGVDKLLITKLLQYGQMLPSPGTPGIISPHLFKAQLGYRFGITSRFHLQCVYEAAERQSKGQVRVSDYVRLLCLFFSNNLDAKIDYVFSVYDLSRDGSISYYELYSLLRTAVTQVDDDDTQGDEPLDDLIDIARNLLDRNRDGKISLEEYRNYVKENILFIQLFGQVLPSDNNLTQFKDLLLSMGDHELKNYFRDERCRCLNIPMTEIESDQKNPLRQLYQVSLDVIDFM